MNGIKLVVYGFLCAGLIGCNPDGIFSHKILSEQTELADTADTASAKVPPVLPMLLSVEINPKPFSMVQNPETNDFLLGVDYDAHFVATGHYDDGSERDITQKVEWSLSDGYVARMEENVLTSQQKGRVTIQARIGPYVSNTLDVLINPVGLITWGAQINDTTYIKPRSYIPVGIRQLVANDYAFAALKLDGTVTTFGNDYGGAFDEDALDPCELFCPGAYLQPYLVNVQKIVTDQSPLLYPGGYNETFVALRHDGSIEWWARSDLIFPDYGNAAWRGDYDSVENAKDVIPHYGSFYAITQDDSVLGFGYLNAYSNFNEVKGDLINVKKLVASTFDFTMAALREDGSVILFGSNDVPLHTYAVDEFTNVIDVEPILYGFIAYREDGSAAYWGDGYYHIEPQVYENVKKAYSSAHHGVILTNDGDIIDMRTHELILAGDLSNPVMDIVATPSGGLFAALMKNGDVFSWGEATGPENGRYPVYGSGRNIDYQDVAADLHDVVKIQATKLSILAVKKDGSVVTWGDAENGGDSSSVRDQLFNVVDVRTTNYPRDNVITALKQDGTLVVWGNSIVSPDQVSEFKNVAHIQANQLNFAGIQVWED